MSKQDKAALRYLETKGVMNYNDKMRMIGSLKHDVPNLRLDNCKFVTAGLRMYYNDELSNYQSITTFNRILKDISIGNHSDEYDFNLNGLTLEELSLKYAEAEKIDTEKDRIRSINRKFIGDSYYTIVPIETFEEANKYCEYTSWCITQSEETFKSLNCGGNRFYFCLKDGFENVIKNDDNAPLNEYGLSMIAVNIDMYGNLDAITTRYNHNFFGENNEGLRNVEQLEDILNIPFYSTFLPYTREELHEHGVILFDEVQGLLDGGKLPKDIFENIVEPYNTQETDYKLVYLNNKYNWITKDHKLLFPNKWFDHVGEFFDGYTRVVEKNKQNLMDVNGNFISEQWFESCTNFIDGIAMVKLPQKGCNWINTKGEILFPNKWFDNAYNFVDGYAVVMNKNGKNLINKKGELSFTKWYQNLTRYSKDLAIISFLDKNGNNNIKFYKIKEQKFTTRKLFKGYQIMSVSKNNKFYRFFKVYYNGKWNLIDENGDFVNPNYWSYFVLQKYRNDFIVIGTENNNYKDIYCDENGDLIIEEEKFLETILKKHNEN